MRTDPSAQKGADMNFICEMPTRVIAGRGCVIEHAEEMKRFGSRALIVTGKHSARRNGALADVEEALRKNGQTYAVFDGAVPNPPIDTAVKGGRCAREEKADFIIAIGGGSPMDTGKAAALLACRDLGEEELFMKPYDEGALPIVCVPTTAGTGSEVTRVAVLTSAAKQTKRSVAGRAMFPKLSFLDGKYMHDLGRETTLNTAVDAMSHAIEGIFAKGASPVTDAAALESVRILSGYLEKMDHLEEQPLTDEDRDRLLYAAMLAGTVIANTGTNLVHAMGYNLTFFKGSDHGRANGLLLSSYLEFVSRSYPEKVRTVLNQMGMKDLAQWKGTLAELFGTRETLSEEELDRFTRHVQETKRSSYEKCIAPVTAEDIRRIYRESLPLPPESEAL